MIDLKGNIIIPTGIYDYIGDFNDGLAMVRNFDDKYGYVDINGNVVVPIIYVQASNFSEGLAIIHREEKISDINPNYQSAVINTSGDFVIPFGNFEHYIMFGFYDGTALVSMGDDTYGYIDRNGNLLFQHDRWTYDIGYSFFGFHEGYASFSIDWKYGFIDKAGSVAIPFEYDSATYFVNGYAVVKKGDYYGVIDTTGQIIVPFEYDSIDYGHDYNFDLSSDLYLTRKDGKYGLLSKERRLLLPAEYDYIHIQRGEQNPAPIHISQQGKHGFINNLGEFVIPLIYDSAQNFMDGYASVSKDGKYGVINEIGDFVIPFGEYEFVNVVGEGCALVQNGDEQSIIKLSATTILK